MIERFWESREAAEAWTRERLLPFLPPLSGEHESQLVNALVMLAPPEIDHVSHPMVCRALSAAGLATEDFPGRFVVEFPPCAVELDLLYDPLFLALGVRDILLAPVTAAVVEYNADVWIGSDGYVAPVDSFERILGRRRHPTSMSLEVFSDELFAEGAAFTSYPDEKKREPPWDTADYVRPDEQPLPSELAREGWVVY